MESKQAGDLLAMLSAMVLELQFTYQTCDLEEATMAKDSLLQVLSALDVSIQVLTRHCEEEANTKTEQ